MTILLDKPYLIKEITKGKGVKIPKKLTTWFMDDPFDLIDVRGGGMDQIQT